MPDDSTVRLDDVIGTWRLVSYTASDDGGALRHPLGPDATGFLMYTTDGYMSVHMMRRGRADYDRPDIQGGTTDEYAEAAQGYLAYAGPFGIDEHQPTLTHAVEASLLPNWLGSVQLRRPFLAGSRLTMRARYVVESVTVDSILTWDRAPELDPRSR